ncbi:MULTISPECIES: M15 family metallopeptidase [unclassified Thermosynechococcus]|uniref:M15 family metallopeptidase n=1 Tax=unclassified Thermosynechococcus TaxID=2622553 RepID=UPI0026733753|nr:MULTISPECIES: M15 family metallopeptidase [unclassified Thermosynechococcus]WKT80744.1 M15 family metallopeptidase [Thermosynechococcus sp. PP45]WNC24356.1 M15 family metallopeptidase [Thermosynechococcus sp. PP551]WNC26934.1 M15 family metallopeptidase [Thermosynechococcus sp. PP555]WNC32037.1 M15 family metallopeptidase [Thermosynechococcus sp. PKX95]WNC34566.1 M15 family metallopeptidase [Thermosynechococcus sp. PKX91]
MGDKPYTKIPIAECGEPLAPIPPTFLRLQPHPYQSRGAPYGKASPFWLRVGVIAALERAQAFLEPYGWQLAIFDAYRPIAVQQFMVAHTFATLCQERGYDAQQLEPAIAREIWQQVDQFWAVPSSDPQQPPPHSTGAAVDLTLADPAGHPFEMGGVIDEVSERSFPDFYDRHPEQANAACFSQRRKILYQAMRYAGFQRHPNEWWHFSLGDQLWAWQTQQQTGQRDILARYGRVDL